MKIVVRGRYKGIDNLLEEIRLDNRTTHMVIEYPEAYYHSDKNWKGVAVAYTDGSYLDFSAVSRKRFRNLDVCVTGAGYVWNKVSGTCNICCKNLHSEYRYQAVPALHGDKFSSELDGYETLDLWENRVSGVEL